MLFKCFSKIIPFDPDTPMTRMCTEKQRGQIICLRLNGWSEGEPGFQSRNGVSLWPLRPLQGGREGHELTDPLCRVAGSAGALGPQRSGSQEAGTHGSLRPTLKSICLQAKALGLGGSSSAKDLRGRRPGPWAPDPSPWGPLPVPTSLSRSQGRGPG